VKKNHLQTKALVSFNISTIILQNIVAHMLEGHNPPVSVNAYQHQQTSENQSTEILQ